MPYVLTYIAMDDEDQVTTNDQSENDIIVNVAKRPPLKADIVQKALQNLDEICELWQDKFWSSIHYFCKILKKILKCTTYLKIDGHEWRNQYQQNI